jgi:hypothetical protein
MPLRYKGFRQSLHLDIAVPFTIMEKVMRENLTIAVTPKEEMVKGLAGAAPVNVERCL